MFKQGPVKIQQPAGITTALFCQAIYHNILWLQALITVLNMNTNNY